MTQETTPPEDLDVAATEDLETEQPELLEAEPDAAVVEELIEERDQLKDQLLRTLAEFDNFKRRTRREKDQLYTDSVSDVVTAFLPVMDNLERALLACENTEGVEAKALAEGVRMIGRQADETLVKLGVSEIESEGVPFDPNIHHAVAQVADETVDSGTVVDVLAKGYSRGDRVIRHAMVRVAE